MGSNYQPYTDITASIGNDDIANSTDSVSKAPLDFYHQAQQKSNYKDWFKLKYIDAAGPH